MTTPGTGGATWRARRGWLVALVIATLLLGACGVGGTSGKPVALASFYPLGYFTTAIAGDRMTVRDLVPPSVEPHDWEPSARDMADLKSARVFVYNGAGLEAWVPRVLAAAPSASRVDVEATRGLPLTGAPTGEQGVDPHVWLDPVLAKEVASRIADGLTRADPAGKEVYATNLRALQARLDRLDADYRQGLSDCRRHEIVTSHAAFGYLARRYGLEQIAVEGLAPDAEPTPARMAEITQLARQRGVTTIFFETLVSPRVAETIAKEIGAKTMVLDPIEGVANPQQEDYFTVMRANLANLRVALGCR